MSRYCWRRGCEGRTFLLDSDCSKTICHISSGFTLVIPILDNLWFSSLLTWRWHLYESPSTRAVIWYAPLLLGSILRSLMTFPLFEVKEKDSLISNSSISAILNLKVSSILPTQNGSMLYDAALLLKVSSDIEIFLMILSAFLMFFASAKPLMSFRVKPIRLPPIDRQCSRLPI